MNLEYFDLTSGCLVTDIMHDVLEGKHLLPIGSRIQMKTVHRNGNERNSIDAQANDI